MLFSLLVFMQSQLNQLSAIVSYFAYSHDIRYGILQIYFQILQQGTA